VEPRNNLVLLAKGLDRSRFEPHVVLLTRDGPYRQDPEQAGIPVTLIGKRFKLDFGSFFRLVRFLKEQKFDLRTYVEDFRGQQLWSLGSEPVAQRCHVLSRVKDVWMNGSTGGISPSIAI
jgi:hypothetical protein